MSIEIKANFDKEIKDFADLARHIRRNAELGLDKALDSTLETLRSDLLTYINNTVTSASSTAADNNDQPQDVPSILNIPLAKNALIKYIFGQDISQSDYEAKSLGNKTVNDNSNVFMLKDKKRIKAWQTIGDSSTLEGEEAKFRNRLIKGIVIDEDNGKIYKLKPVDVRGIKLECSRDTGSTLDSQKKFEAYKNSGKMVRRKDGPDQRLAVWTIKQEDVQTMMQNALSIDTLIQKIQDGEEESAIAILDSINQNNELSEAIQKVKNLKLKKELTPDIQVYQDIVTLIRNLSISKNMTADSSGVTTYTLFSNYGDRAEENTLFFDEMRNQIYLWILTNQDFWFKSLMDQIVIGLQKYDAEAKFT